MTTTKENDALDLILENLQKSYNNLAYEARKLELEAEFLEYYDELLYYLKTLRV